MFDYSQLRNEIIDTVATDLNVDRKVVKSVLDNFENNLVFLLSNPVIMGLRRIRLGGLGVFTIREKRIHSHINRNGNLKNYFKLLLKRLH